MNTRMLTGTGIFIIRLSGVDADKSVAFDLYISIVYNNVQCWRSYFFPFFCGALARIYGLLYFIASFGRRVGTAAAVVDECMRFYLRIQHCFSLVHERCLYEIHDNGIATIKQASFICKSSKHKRVGREGGKNT